MCNCNLENFFIDPAKGLPLATDGNESFTFTAETLSISPSEIESQNIYIKKSQHTYNDSWRYDLPYFNAHKETYRYLGLLILSVIFHPQPAGEGGFRGVGINSAEVTLLLPEHNFGSMNIGNNLNF